MNSLMVIFPYKYEGCWVFDDPAAGLIKEPWLCPALFQYFVEAPKEIYVRAEPKSP
jgi:hypothetical protein